MQAFQPCRIIHQDVSAISEDNIPVAGSYIIFWSGNCPVGNYWMPNAGAPPSPAQYVEKARSIVDPVLNWYKKNPPVTAETLLSLSIIICSRNRADSLKNSIESILNNGDTDFELIIVDNAASDESTRDLVRNYKQVQYIRELRAGLDIARNTGARAAKNQLIAYTDDDVLVSKNWVQDIKKAFYDPEVMAVTGLLIPYALETRAQYHFEKYWGFNKGYIPKIFDHDYFVSKCSEGYPAWDVGAGANMAFRRTAFELVGGFDERLGAGASGCGDDSEFWYRILAEGWKCAYIPSLFAFHNHRESETSLGNQLFNYMRGHVAALLVQYEKYKHKGNLDRLFHFLPRYYYQKIKNRLAGREDAEYIFHEIKGMIAGWFYYHFRKKDPGYTKPFFTPYAINHKAVVTEDTLVSVIIPCYNHGKYLAEAIESVLKQDHQQVEVIVVDDGSDQDIPAICSHYPKVRCIRKSRAGVSVARNIGVQHARGQFIIFLDADDFLYPGAINSNLSYFIKYPYLAYVSGSFDLVNEKGECLETKQGVEKAENNYLSLLQGNYIGMEATVMYKRAVFFGYHFDPGLKMGEDYDLNLRIARYFQVYGHTGKIAAYRIHRQNTSGDRKSMLKMTLLVLRRQKSALLCRTESIAYKKGIRNWIGYYNSTKD